MLRIDQSAFIRNLVKEEGMRDYNPVSTPMKAGNYIEMQDKKDYKKADIKAYQHLIGKLMYLFCGTRPDISFVMRQLSKRNADPRIEHLKLAKRVVRYLKGTMHLRFTYDALPPSEKETKALVVVALFRPVRYADSNYAGNPEDRKSVMGHCFFIHGVVIS